MTWCKGPHAYVTGRAGHRISGCIHCGYDPSRFTHWFLDRLRRRRRLQRALSARRARHAASHERIE